MKERNQTKHLGIIEILVLPKIGRSVVLFNLAFLQEPCLNNTCNIQSMEIPRLMGNVLISQILTRLVVIFDAYSCGNMVSCKAPS